MPSKSTLIYKLTPAQIAFVDRLATSEDDVRMDALKYSEVVAYQELAKLGMTDMQVGSRRRVAIVLTDLGRQVRAKGYFSKKPVIRLTEPQINALRFLVGGHRHYNEIPAHMIDVCRRMGLRGWAEWEEDDAGGFRVRITTEGWQVLMLVDAPVNTRVD
ncbi:hypothetical protein [Mesorhizobium sp. A623]